MGTYYGDRPDQLSEKLKDQYEMDMGDYLFMGFIIISIIIAFIIG